MNANEDLVQVACGCPGCGERRIDALVWQNDEDEQVRCSTCGFIYSPGLEHADPTFGQAEAQRKQDEFEAEMRRRQPDRTDWRDEDTIARGRRD